MIQSKNGFSLVSVMVAVAIIGIVALGSISLFENMTKSQNMAEFRNLRDVLVEEIRAHLSDTLACKATLGAIPLSTNGHQESLTQIKNADGTAKWQTGTAYSNNTFRITNLTFTYAPGTSVTAPSTGSGNLMVQLTAIKKVAGISVSDPKYINISIKRNPATGAMLECIASAKMSDGIWQRSPVVSDIFYAGGNVGIGTTQPASTLEIFSPAGPNWDMTIGMGGPNQGYYLSSNYNAGHSGEGRFTFYRTRGSKASPSNVQKDDMLGGVYYSGYPASSAFSQSAAIISRATENFSGSSGGNIEFWTSTNGVANSLSEKMRVDHNGYVGIQNAAPIVPLHVNGAIATSSSVAAALNALIFSVEAPDTGVINFGHFTGGTAGGQLDFRMENTTRMTILNNGNVGIGLSNPIYPLEVRNNGGGINTTAAIFRATSPGGACVQMGDGSTTSVLPGVCSQGDHLSLWTNGLERM